jgi:hypothetical protein
MTMFPASMRSVTLLALGAFALIACKSNTVSQTNPTDYVSQDVPPSGAVLRHESGLVVVIPAGALAASTTLTIGTQPGGAYPDFPAKAPPLEGPVFVLTPHGTAFHVPITIYMPIPDGATPSSLEPWTASGDGASWASVQVPDGVVSTNDTYDGKPKVSVTTAHFSYYALFGASADGSVDAAPSCSLATCPNGCCDTNGACQPGNSSAACGTGGARCGACSQANGCVSGHCRCAQTSDCPVNQACDVAAGTCTNSCVVGGNTLACNTGCCDLTASKQCVGGGAGGTLCGTNGGVCVDCSASAAGHVCQLGGVCGCTAAKDCPPNQACVNGTCGTACSSGVACNGGCCDGTKCQPGNTASACGATGGACVACSGADAGAACEASGACGCASSSDCTAPSTCGGGGTPNVCGCTPKTCQTAGYQCGSHSDGCGGTLSCGNCNGSGCCTVAGACAAGTASTACGEGGGTCRVCAGATPTCGTVNAVTSCYCTKSPNSCGVSQYCCFSGMCGSTPGC